HPPRGPDAQKAEDLAVGAVDDPTGRPGGCTRPEGSINAAWATKTPMHFARPAFLRAFCIPNPDTLCRNPLRIGRCSHCRARLGPSTRRVVAPVPLLSQSLTYQLETTII